MGFRFPPLLLAVFATLLAAYCVEPVVVQNYPEYLPESEVAIIRKSGYRLAVSESGRWGDTLQLRPGKYLLEFTEKFTGVQGAALCTVQAGGIYEIEIVRKRYMEMSGRYVYEGKCNRLNRPPEPKSEEFPEADRSRREAEAEAEAEAEVEAEVEEFDSDNPSP